MNYVTYGGVTIGLGILFWFLAKWNPGIKSLRSDPMGNLAPLLPFFLAWAYGCLTTLGVGGFIGWVSGTALGISNWLGDVALTLGVGSGWAQTSAGTFVPLSQYGLPVVFLLTLVMIATIKNKKLGPKYGSDLIAGTWCGICLGTSAGIAGVVAAPLATAANWLGTTVYGAF